MAKVCVLLGGNSSEREVSLRSGAVILKALRARGVDAESFDYHGNNLWELRERGYEKVLIALHGGAGENGAIQGFLEVSAIPYTGSGVLASALCMDKQRSKELARAYARVPKDIVLSRDEAQERLAANDSFAKEGAALAYPLVVKPSQDGSSVGVSIVQAAQDLAAAVSLALEGKGAVMLEEYVGGYELTVAVLHGRALGVCEIVPKHGFYDYEAKYIRNDTQYLVPSTLGADIERIMCEQAEALYAAFGCKGVARVDFLANSKKELYFLELNTVPGMTEKSLVPKIAQAAGIGFEELCLAMLE
ncbi:MAG: D-alanine--D-alanine ligase [Bradymonadales bacterium]|jgi:D-alanine-D-alanine ligase